MLEKEGFAVSTDAVGVFGRPLLLKEVWGPAMEQSGFLGLEVLAWHHVNISKLAEQYPVVGIHGKIRASFKGFDLYKLASGPLLDFMITDTASLIEKYGTSTPYMLFHQREAGFSKNIIQQTKPIQTLFVENSPHLGSLEEAIKLISDFREAGINTGLMFDLYHYLAGISDLKEIYSSNFPELWDLLMQKLQNTFTEIDQQDTETPIGIHIPVGTRREDSLPVDQITEDMWKQLGGAIHQRPYTLVVIENQQAGIGTVMLTPFRIESQRSRNMEIFKKLLENNVIINS